MHSVTKSVDGTTRASSGAAVRSLSRWSSLLLVFVGTSLLLRMATFGHPNIDGDEAFYFLVGQAMHDGAVPYVDIWDRKPVGLFVIFWLIAGISKSVVAYQVAAALFAGATAAVIATIASRWAGLRGALLAGLAYLLLLPLLWGYGGQAPVFYNLFIATAALLVMDALPALRQGRVPWQAGVAMLICGLAITVKQTTLFEAVYFGFVLIAALLQSSAPRRRIVVAFLALAAIGAAPTLAVSAWYWLAGYWSEYWHAMVISNISKPKPNGISVLARSLGLYLRLAPIACAAILGLALRLPNGRTFSEKRFLVGWLIAAVLGFLSVPNFYMHYALPLLVPLCIAAAAFFARKGLGLAAFAIAAGFSLHWFYPFAFEYTREARRAFDAMTRSIRAHDAGRDLFLFDGPVLLYASTGKRPPSPLVLPMHFNYGIEKDVSHLRTSEELARVLANAPGAVMMPVVQRNNPRNEESWRMVLSYVRANCRLIDVQRSHEMISSASMALYGDCRPQPSPGTSR